MRFNLKCNSRNAIQIFLENAVCIKKFQYEHHYNALKMFFQTFLYDIRFIFQHSYSTKIIKNCFKNVQAINEELESLNLPLQECRRMGEMLSGICGSPAKMELQKHLEDLDTLTEELEEGTKERAEELKHSLDKADKFDSTFQVGIKLYLY